MPRLARVVVPHYPHHIIQRGNRRQDVFYKESDYHYYISLLKAWCEEEQIDILAYCLMTNHVHLVLVPGEEPNLSRAVGETHRRYTRMINFREKWKGYLWQGRYSSYVLDVNWLLATLAYVELNPVKAKMVVNAWDYRWSSIHGHLTGSDPFGLMAQNEHMKYVQLEDWKEYIHAAQHTEDKQIMQHERTGRPLGSEQFIDNVGVLLGRDLKKKQPGPKVK
ncbi:MAG: transposase [Arenicellales bacterium]